MRNTLIICLICLLGIGSVQARKKRDKSGEINAGVFTDKEYGYSLTLIDGWSPSPKKNKLNFRLSLTQKNFEVPSDFSSAPDYTQVPRIVVWVDTTSYSPRTFVDSLVSESFQSEQKDDILKEFEILGAMGETGTRREKTVPRKKKAVTIAGEIGYMWTAKSQYTKEVATSATSLGGKKIQGAFGGAIIAAKKDDIIIVFHLMTEWDYFDTLLDETLTFVNSLAWGEREE